MLTLSKAARISPIPTASSIRPIPIRRIKLPFDFLAVVVGSSNPAFQSTEPPLLRLFTAKGTSEPLMSSLAERPEATRFDDFFRLSARGRLRRGDGESGSANLRRSSSDDAFATCWTVQVGAGVLAVSIREREREVVKIWRERYIRERERMCVCVAIIRNRLNRLGGAI